MHRQDEHRATTRTEDPDCRCICTVGRPVLASGDYTFLSCVWVNRCNVVMSPRGAEIRARSRSTLLPGSTLCAAGVGSQERDGTGAAGALLVEGQIGGQRGKGHSE